MSNVTLNLTAHASSLLSFLRELRGQGTPFVERYFWEFGDVPDRELKGSRLCLRDIAGLESYLYIDMMTIIVRERDLTMVRLMAPDYMVIEEQTG